jgi:hypothetical protein
MEEAKEEAEEEAHDEPADEIWIFFMKFTWNIVFPYI